MATRSNAHAATKQARKGRCENQGILSTHDVTFSLCLKRPHLNRELIGGCAQQTRQERAARLSPSMNDSREFPIELWPHHIGVGETRLIVFNLGGNGLRLTLRVTHPPRHTFGFSPLIGDS